MGCACSHKLCKGPKEYANEGTDSIMIVKRARYKTLGQKGKQVRFVMDRHSPICQRIICRESTCEIEIEISWPDLNDEQGLLHGFLVSHPHLLQACWELQVAGTESRRATSKSGRNGPLNLYLALHQKGLAQHLHL